jgi:hypothetical protein
MKWGKFKWTSPCCAASMRKHYDDHGLETFWCMKCGKYVPWLKVILTDGTEGKSMEEINKKYNSENE